MMVGGMYDGPVIDHPTERDVLLDILSEHREAKKELEDASAKWGRSSSSGGDLLLITCIPDFTITRAYSSRSIRLQPAWMTRTLKVSALEYVTELSNQSTKGGVVWDHTVGLGSGVRQREIGIPPPLLYYV